MQGADEGLISGISIVESVARVSGTTHEFVVWVYSKVDSSSVFLLSWLIWRHLDQENWGHIMSIRLLAKCIFEDHARNQIVGSTIQGFENTLVSITTVLAGSIVFLCKQPSVLLNAYNKRSPRLLGYATHSHSHIQFLSWKWGLTWAPEGVAGAIRPPLMMLCFADFWIRTSQNWYRIR